MLTDFAGALGLTPATVFYYQWLAEDPPLPPRDILEMIVNLADSPGTQPTGAWPARPDLQQAGRPQAAH